MAERQDINESLARIIELTEKGQWGSAESACEDLLRFAPHESRAWLHLAVSKLQRGGLVEAEQALGKLIALDPTNIEGWSLLANVAFQRGKPDVAATCSRMA